MRLALPLALVVALAGCTQPSNVSREDLEFPVVSSVSNVTPDETGGIQAIATDGLRLAADPSNHTVTLGLGADVTVPGTLRACRDACDDIDLPSGMLVAEGSLVSFHNVSLNAAGPDGDSAVFFHDGGAQAGQWVRWSDGKDRFEVSEDLDIAGNVTSSGYVGSSTQIERPEGSLRILTGALEGNEAAVYLRGSATLTNGTAEIVFPQEYALLVGDGLMTVHLTPTSRIPPLFVAGKAKDRMLIATTELSNATGTFDLLVIAPRAGTEGFTGLG